VVSKLTTKPPSGAGVSRVIVNVPLVGPVSVGVVPAAMLTLGVLLRRMEVVSLSCYRSPLLHLVSRRC
jgi:hypothetical protein